MAPLTAAQWGLVVSSLPLARWIAARRSMNTPWRRQDYEDAAVDGLIDAARIFDPAIGRPFSHLATVIAKRRIMNLDRVACRVRGPVDALDAPREGAVDMVAVDGRVSDDDVDFAALIAVLGPLERRMLSLKFEHDLIDSEIGHEVGFNRRKVMRYIHRALKTLSATLAG